MGDRAVPPLQSASIARPCDAPRISRARLVASQVVGVAGIALYNWWFVVLFDRHLLTSPDAFFSDLEAVGRPDASLLSHFDLAAGVLIVVALLLRGALSRGEQRPEWKWLVGYGVAGTFTAGTIAFAGIATGRDDDTKAIYPSGY